MTKNEIKAALDLQGAAYPKKANLAELVKLYNAHCVGEEGPYLHEDGTPENLDAVAADHDIKPEADAPPALTEVDYDTMSYDEVRDSNCPHCDIHLSNGLLTYQDEVANKPGITLHMEGMNRAYECMGCGGQFGPTYDPYVAQEDARTGTGLKIEKDRPEQNGVKRPSIGGKCRAIWDALDSYRAETGELPTSKTVKELAADEGWNPNNASIEFYQWRKFNGIGKA